MPTVVQLRAQAKSKGLKGYSKLRKSELETLLNQGVAKGKQKAPVVVVSGSGRSS